MCSLSLGKVLTGTISDSFLELAQYLLCLNRISLCYCTDFIQDFNPRKMRMENKHSPLIQHTEVHQVQHCTFPYSTHRCFPTISYLEKSMQNKVLTSAPGQAKTFSHHSHYATQRTAVLKSSTTLRSTAICILKQNCFRSTRQAGKKLINFHHPHH